MYKVLFAQNHLLCRICPRFRVKNQTLLFGDRSVSIFGINVRLKPDIGPNYLDRNILFSSRVEPNLPSKNILILFNYGL